MNNWTIRVTTHKNICITQKVYIFNFHKEIIPNAFKKYNYTRNVNYSAYQDLTFITWKNGEQPKYPKCIVIFKKLQ